VIREALSRANLRIDDIDYIAVTNRPGLSGALLVGVQAAKAIAWASGKPLIGVDHLVGHLLAAFLRGPKAGPPPTYPYCALLASGGNTSICRVDGPTVEAIRELGGTRDDAAGEAFDKVSKLLGLGYPGGPVIDRFSKKGNPRAIAVPRPMSSGSTLEMSFSGLKTFIASYVGREGLPQTEEKIADLCASFQSAVVDTLVKKTLVATKQEGLSTVVLAGGVAANSGLREGFRIACEKAGYTLVVPPMWACTDNAAMIAYAGAMLARTGHTDRTDLSVSTLTAIRRVTRRGGGPRDNPRRRKTGE
jgi:N6-L-threonylcarbamoyladenine synthase